MRERIPVGILGLGSYLPEEVRRNDFWPAHIVATWRERLQRSFVRSRDACEEAPTPGMRAVLEEMNALKDDPFQGSVERRVMPEDMTTTEMETRAAEEAIRDAGIDRSEIDVVLGYTMCPEVINVPSACVVHHNLGLRRDCLSLNPDGVCNSFQMQLTLATSLLESGRARYALLTQSSALTRLARLENPDSAWWGDGASAVVLGPVSPGRGVLAFSHETEGALSQALVATVPGKHWYDEGRVEACNLSSAQAREMLLRLPDVSRALVHRTLEKAGLTTADVDFYASHQATRWFRPATQRAIGVEHARTFDIFPLTASLSACNLPTVMYMARQEGLLRDGDVVVTNAGGTGTTHGSIVLRWGR